MVVPRRTERKYLESRCAPLALVGHSIRTFVSNDRGQGLLAVPSVASPPQLLPLGRRFEAHVPKGHTYSGSIRSQGKLPNDLWTVSGQELPCLVWPAMRPPLWEAHSRRTPVAIAPSPLETDCLRPRKSRFLLHCDRREPVRFRQRSFSTVSHRAELVCTQDVVLALRFLAEFSVQHLPQVRSQCSTMITCLCCTVHALLTSQRVSMLDVSFACQVRAEAVAFCREQASRA